MIILKDIRCGYLQSVQVELPRANMVIDPRPNFLYDRGRFRCIYNGNGTTVTLTNTDITYSWSFNFRVYDPATETVPSFDSTIYTYFGKDCETAPHDTTVLIIHPSVTVIKRYAFSYCREMKKCFVHDGVHTIEKCAFYCCYAITTIRLSRSLTHIGEDAFSHCDSLEAVFLPPSVNQIDTQAFLNCRNLRILPLPLNMDIQIGARMIYDCHDFFQTTQIEEYANPYGDEGSHVHQQIIHFYRDQVPPLHKTCLDTHVTHQTIQECINTHGRAAASITDHDGMTPLHILAMNPHADISALLACFDWDRSCVFVGDSRGNTPLDYLRLYHDDIEEHTSFITSLCMHRYAATAAAGLSQDDQDDTSTNKNKKRKRANDE